MTAERTNLPFAIQSDVTSPAQSRPLDMPSRADVQRRKRTFVRRAANFVCRMTEKRTLLPFVSIASMAGFCASGHDSFDDGYGLDGRARDG